MKEMQQRRRDGRFITFYDFAEADEGDELPETNDSVVVPFERRPRDGKN